MRFISLRWIEPIALSAVFFIALTYNMIQADETQTSVSEQGGSSVLKVKEPSADSATSESERAASSMPLKESSDTSPPAKGKTSPQPQAAVRDGGGAEKTSSLQQPQRVLEQPTLKNVLPGQIAGEGDSKVGESYALKDQASAPIENAELKPIPSADQSGPVALEAASFKGVTPGTTTIDEVEKAWGPPKEIFKQNNMMMQLYSVEPFERVEVSYRQDIVSSIVIRFEKPFPVNAIAQQLDMAAITPVLVSNEMGEVLGQVYPERGVLFAFEPSQDNGKPSMKVVHIILEPLNAEPFILRGDRTG